MKRPDALSKLKKSAKKEKKINKKKRFIILVSLPIIIALITGITYICGGFETIDYLLFYSHRTIDPSVISDGSFPVSFSGDDIISAENIASKSVVLSKKLLTCISYKGRVLYTEPLSFVEPDMKTEGKYGVVFDRGSDKYIIFDAYGIVYQGTVEGGRSIITADVDSKGNIVLSTKSDDSACRVYMIGKDGETKYIWSCAENYVVSMDIGRKSEKIICGAIGAYNYEIFTDVYVLDIYSDSVVSTYRAENSACVDIKYVDDRNDKVILTCKDKRIVLEMDSEGVLNNRASNTVFKGDCVLIDSDSDGYTAVVTEKYNSPDTKELTLYDKDNNIVFSYNAPSDVVCVLSEEGKVYCLDKKSITTYNKDSEKNTVYNCDMFGVGLIELKGKIRYYSSEIIKNGF